MRYMNWSYDDLMACPTDYLPVIAERRQKEIETALEQQRRALAALR